METIPAEDDCVDSGAETAGSDFSPLSSANSHFSMVNLQDPYLISIHLITDPGQGHFLQRAADGVLAWVHPELQLFRVSERAAQRPTSKPQLNGGCQPALAVILFLQELCDGEQHILTLHRTLQSPPWRYHHTEKVSSGRRMVPLTPCSQDFFTLCPGTPLWAVRQVHYGKEIVRFTIYCRHKNYRDMVRLYKLLLQRRGAQKKEDFCFFVVYSNPDVEIQLSFKRLPRGENPVRLESAVMEVRVRDVGVLVPLLPHPCSPISDVRWQTEDYDGNKILLQVQGPLHSHRPDPCHMSSSVHDSSSAPSTFLRISASHKPRRHQQRVPSRPRAHQTFHNSLPLTGKELEDPQLLADSWRSQRSSSIFSLPNLNSSSSRSTCSSPSPSPRTPHRGSSLIPPFRINVDALIGAEETDVDTGNKVTLTSSVDLSVVSAYIKSKLAQTSRPSSAPPENIGPSLSPISAEYSLKPAALTRTHHSFSIRHTLSSFLDPRPQSFSRSTSAAPSLSDVSINHSDNCSITSTPLEEEMEEEVQEFYI